MTPQHPSTIYAWQFPWHWCLFEKQLGSANIVQRLLDKKISKRHGTINLSLYNLNIMSDCQKQQQSVILKNITRGITIPISSYTTQPQKKNSTILAQRQTYRSVKQNQRRTYKFTQLQPLDFGKDNKNTSQMKDSLFGKQCKKNWINTLAE